MDLHSYGAHTRGLSWIHYPMIPLEGPSHGSTFLLYDIALVPIHCCHDNLLYHIALVPIHCCHDNLLYDIALVPIYCYHDNLLYNIALVPIHCCHDNLLYDIALVPIHCYHDNLLYHIALTLPWCPSTTTMITYCMTSSLLFFSSMICGLMLFIALSRSLFFPTSCWISSSKLDLLSLISERRFFNSWKFCKSLPKTMKIILMHIGFQTCSLKPCY